MPGDYIKCPRCELNYIKRGEEYCAVCKAELKKGDEVVYSSEDFSHYLTKAPGVLVRIGIRNEEIGCGAVCHDAAFKVDEAALKVGCEVLARFALEG